MGHRASAVNARMGDTRVDPIFANGNEQAVAFMTWEIGHLLRMLSHKQDEREIVHAKGSVEQPISVDEEYDVFDGVLDQLWISR